MCGRAFQVLKDIFQHGYMLIDSAFNQNIIEILVTWLSQRCIYDLLHSSLCWVGKGITCCDVRSQSFLMLWYPNFVMWNALVKLRKHYMDFYVFLSSYVSWIWKEAKRSGYVLPCDFRCGPLITMARNLYREFGARFCMAVVRLAHCHEVSWDR